LKDPVAISYADIRNHTSKNITSLSRADIYTTDCRHYYHSCVCVFFL